MIIVDFGKVWKLFFSSSHFLNDLCCWNNFLIKLLKENHSTAQVSGMQRKIKLIFIFFCFSHSRSFFSIKIAKVEKKIFFMYIEKKVAWSEIIVRSQKANSSDEDDVCVKDRAKNIYKKCMNLRWKFCDSTLNTKEGVNYV